MKAPLVGPQPAGDTGQVNQSLVMHTGAQSLIKFSTLSPGMKDEGERDLKSSLKDKCIYIKH